MNGLVCALVFLFTLYLSPQVMANVFNTVVNIQCNHCTADSDYQTAALSALKDREQKVVNVINFSQFDVRKFDVKKLQVEVCSDYGKSATKGYCNMEDGSVLKSLQVTNIAREQVISLSEQLYQLDFFQQQDIQTDPQVASTAWQVVNHSYVANKLIFQWQRAFEYEYSTFLLRWQQGELASIQAGIPLINLSPAIVLFFADGSKAYAEVDFIDSDKQLHFTFKQIVDAHNNHLNLNQDELFELGDSFQFESQRNDDFMKMQQLVEQSGFMTEVKETLTGNTVTVVPCTSTENPCQYGY